MTSTNFCSKILTTVDVNLENAIVTYKSSARVLLSIIEFLSFNRNQIPLVYQTFNHLAQNLEKLTETNNEMDICASDLALQRQRDLAISTNKQFQEISDIVAKSFKTTEFEQSVIVFGATLHTAKEAFIVNLPPISRNHLAENHQDAPQSITRKVIMSMITSTNFFDVNCNDLKLTNMFLYVKPKENDKIISANENQFELCEDFRLPSACRTTLINIAKENENFHEKCCQNLSIFDEFGQNEKSAMQTNSPKMQNEKETAEANNGNFYECKVPIKGFKDQLIKGKSIWTN